MPNFIEIDGKKERIPDLDMRSVDGMTRLDEAITSR